MDPDEDMTHAELLEAWKRGTPVELDFSRFHPLDHRIGSRRCWKSKGKIWYHAKYWWLYKRDSAWADSAPSENP